MDPMIWAAIISGVVALAGTITNNVVNKQSTDDTNAKNEALMRESWERDDSTMQRTRADVEKAGFSPMAALGNTIGNSGPVTMQPFESNIDTSGITDAIKNGMGVPSQRSMIAYQKKQMEALDLQNENQAILNRYEELKILKQLKEMDLGNESLEEQINALISENLANGVYGYSDSTGNHQTTDVLNRGNWELGKNRNIESDIANKKSSTRSNNANAFAQEMENNAVAEKVTVDGQTFYKDSLIDDLKVLSRIERNVATSDYNNQGSLYSQLLKGDYLEAINDPISNNYATVTIDGKNYTAKSTRQFLELLQTKYNFLSTKHAETLATIEESSPTWVQAFQYLSQALGFSASDAVGGVVRSFTPTPSHNSTFNFNTYNNSQGNSSRR